MEAHIAIISVPRAPDLSSRCTSSFLIIERADKDERGLPNEDGDTGPAPVCRESKVQERRQHSRRPRDSGLMSFAACVSANAHDGHEYMRAYTHLSNTMKSDREKMLKKRRQNFVRDYATDEYVN